MNEENNWNNRMLLDDEMPEEIIPPSQPDTDTFTDNVTF
jgi:hypothetical protein